MKFKDYLTEAKKVKELLTAPVLKLAKARGVTIEENDVKGVEVVELYATGEKKPLVTYRKNEDGTLSFFTNGTLPQQIKEELPNWIDSQDKLKEVTDFLRDEGVTGS